MKKHIYTVFFFFILSYAMVAFCVFEINPAAWAREERIAATGIFLTVAFIYLMFQSFPTTDRRP